MAAKTKAELQDVTQKEFEKLMTLITAIGENAATTKREEDTSIKDVIAHRAHWIDLFLGWYADGIAGKAVYFPAKGYKWNDLKRYNAALRQQQADVGWADVVKMLQTNHDKLTGFIQNTSDKKLYGAPMEGANNAWTPGRWAEAAGPSHYRSASKYLRASIKADKLQS